MYCKPFNGLTKQELYAILRLRQDVFIIEQQSIYSDVDHEDQDATHFFDYDGNEKLVMYARHRLDKSSKEIKIERVVLAKQVRGKGQGKHLVESVLRDIKTVFPKHAIALSSQLDVCSFYLSLGFESVGEPYDDGGIAHIRMVLQEHAS